MGIRSNDDPGHFAHCNYTLFFVIGLPILLGFLYSVFLSYPDQFFSPFTIISDLSEEDVTDATSSYLIGVGYLPQDSARYLRQGLQFSLSERPLADFFRVLAGWFSNISLFYIAKIAHKVLPQNPYVVIALINHLFMLLTLRNYMAMARILKISESRFLPWIGGNLILIYVLYSLNKEAIGMFLVSEFVLFEYRQSYPRVLFSLFLALMTRNVLFGFGVITVINHFVKLKPWKVLVIFAAILLPVLFYITGGAILGEEFGQLGDATYQHGQKSSAITTYFFKYEEYPMGYFLSYIVVLAVNVLGPFLNYGYWKDYFTVFVLSQFLLQLSSLLFALLIWKTVRGRLFTTAMWEGPLKFVFYYTMISCIMPFSQHRYLIPIYPVLVLSYVYCCEKVPRSTGRVFGFLAKDTRKVPSPEFVETRSG